MTELIIHSVRKRELDFSTICTKIPTIHKVRQKAPESLRGFLVPENGRKGKVQEMHPMRRVRLEQGLSQAALAKMAGVSAQTVLNLETGTHSTHELTAWRLSKALGINPEAILQEEEKKEAHKICS